MLVVDESEGRALKLSPGAGSSALSIRERVLPLFVPLIPARPRLIPRHIRKVLRGDRTVSSHVLLLLPSENCNCGAVDTSESEKRTIVCADLSAAQLNKSEEQVSISTAPLFEVRIDEDIIASPGVNRLPLNRWNNRPERDIDDWVCRLEIGELEGIISPQIITT